MNDALMVDCIVQAVADFDSGKQDEAISSLQLLVRKYPERVEPRVVLAQHLSERKDYSAASELMLECVELTEDVKVLRFAGEIFTKSYDYKAATDVLLRVLGIDASDMECYSMLGHAYVQMGNYSQAVAVFRHLESIYKLSPVDMVDYALALFRCRHGMELAIRHILRAIQLDPDNVHVGVKLALVMTYCGESQAAAQCYRLFAFKEIKHNLVGFAAFYSSYLLQLNYDWGMDPSGVFTEHCKFGELIGEEYVEPEVNRVGEGPLKLGFISGDIYTHPVAFFLMPLLEELDRGAFEIHVYSSTPPDRIDGLTPRISELADVWHEVADVPFGSLHERIREDGLDCLVDLSGHTGSNRLMAFARRAAPVQVTWLGYPNTTGLKNMDYRIVDSVTDPCGEGEGYYSESLVRMDGCFLCYRGSDKDDGSLFSPADLCGPIIFSSNNNWLKLSPGTLGAWGKILQAVPDSRLRLKYNFADDVDISHHLMQRFEEYGIDCGRVDFKGSVHSFEEHLGSFNEVDISLDPFPYNGTTSTCDSLYMGVPVVALRGGRHSARVSASILTAIGYGELAGESVEEYIDIAVNLASDRNRLLVTKKGIREAMLNSPLMDAKDFAGRFGKCLQGLLVPA